LGRQHCYVAWEQCIQSPLDLRKRVTSCRTCVCHLPASVYTGIRPAREIPAQLLARQLRPSSFELALNGSRIALKL
jgi:hypothetical protein